VKSSLRTAQSDEHLSGLRKMSVHREKISKDKQGFIESVVDHLDKQSRNNGSKGGIIPRAPYHCRGAKSLHRVSNDCGGCRKVPTMSHINSSVQYICFRKTSGSIMGAPNLLLVPGAI